MKISQIIQNRIYSSEFKITDKNGVFISVKQVRKEYSAIKGYLHNNLKPHEIIAIKATKDYRYLLTVLAAFDLGITYIPMMESYPDHRVQQIREDSDFKLLLTDEIIAEVVNSGLTFEGSQGEVSLEHTAYIIFTSGSTGKPKGVMIPRRAILNFIEWVGEEFSYVSSSDSLLQVTEFTFDIVFTDVALFLTRNVSVFFSNFQNDLFRFAFEIETYKISTLSTVPNNLSMLLSDVMKDRVDLSSLKSLMIAGARFSFGLYQKCKDQLGTQIHLFNLYGPTESTVYSHGKKMTFNEELDCAGLNISIGKPLLNVTALIFKDGEVKKVREEGELLLGGIQLLKGYMNDPEKTKNVLVSVNNQIYYRTGDIAFFDERDDYYVIGRLDDTIKVRGFRVNLLDVDSYIHKLSYVEDCATIAIPHEVAENQTIAFMRIKSPKTVKEVKRDLLEYLLDYQIPEKIIFVEKYPVNSSGKIDKKVLKEQYLNSTYKN
jgi:acyl-coenzyme A synthetase/AMP-(fatty) acid ligase